MLTFEPGNDIALVVPFLVDGEPAVPEVGSVNFTLRDNDGSIIALHDEEPVTTGQIDTQATLTIDAAAIDIGISRFEQRTLIVRARIAGQPWQYRLAFRVAPFINTTATPADVRSYIGIGRDELPDEDIDLFAAYMQVETVATKETLENALASGTVRALQANKAIIARAVLDVLPSLRQRLLQSRTDGSIAAERSKIDLTAIAERARSDYGDTMNAVTERVISALPMFIFSNDTDVITGA